MSTMYSTGPILVWAGPQVYKPAQGTALPVGPPIYIGTAEVCPQAERRKQYHPAFNDLSGAVPFDMNFLGEDAVIAIDLTRYDEANYQFVTRAPRQAGVGGSLGGEYDAFHEMGSLMAHDGLTLCVYTVFPHGNPINLAGLPGRVRGLPPGVRWHGGSIVGDKYHQMGSRYRKTHITIQCTPVYDHTRYKFCLYDNGIPPELMRPPAHA